MEKSVLKCSGRATVLCILPYKYSILPKSQTGNYLRAQIISPVCVNCITLFPASCVWLHENTAVPLVDAPWHLKRLSLRRSPLRFKTEAVDSRLPRQKPKPLDILLAQLKTLIVSSQFCWDLGFFNSILKFGSISKGRRKVYWTPTPITVSQLIIYLFIYLVPRFLKGFQGIY